MNSEKFKTWLEHGNRNKTTLQNRISNCKNVEKHEGNLDDHFAKDRGFSLLEKLKYSTKNERNKDTPKHNIPIDGNIRNGSATLKQAVNLYFQFKRSEINHEEQIEQTEAFLSNIELTQTEKTILTKFRIGQSFFRNDLITYWKGSCSVSGFAKQELLIASHIKPYINCNTHEKYDLFNGLLLTPNYDKLFDRHLISFNEKGKIMISTSLTKEDLDLLHITSNDSIQLDKRHLPYMQHHRTRFLEQSSNT